MCEKYTIIKISYFLSLISYAQKLSISSKLQSALPPFNTKKMYNASIIAYFSLNFFPTYSTKENFHRQHDYNKSSKTALKK